MKHLPKAISALKKNPVLLGWGVLFDVAHMFSFSVFLTEVWMKILEGMEKMNTVMQSLPVPDELTGEAMQAIISQESLIQAHSAEVVGWFIALCVGAYGLWVAFQGGAWWIAHKMVKDKVTRKYFIPRFLVITLVTQLLVLVGSYFIGRLSLFSLLEVDDSLIIGMTGLLSLCVLYLQQVAYIVVGRQPFWKWFKRVAGRLDKLVPAFLLMLALIGITNAIAVALYGYDIVLGVIATLLLVGPSYTFARVYGIYVAKYIR